MTRPVAYHTSVLLSESVDALGVRPDGTYVDVTFGGGGHSREILRRLGPDGRLIAFDQDADAVANAPADPRLVVVRHNFRFLADFVDYVAQGPVDGVLGDLGVSSHHFDEAGRGFSFKHDGPLDMRMNRGAKISAADVVNGYEAAALARVLGEWGEVDKPFRVVNAIVRARAEAPIGTTGRLRQVVEGVVRQDEQNKTLTKVFQALRIEVNGEMEALDAMLRGCAKVLRPGGRMVMIAYHSLEDRMVKNMMRSGDPQKAQAEQDAVYGSTSVPFAVSQRKPVVPGAEEVEANPRARSAKLRWATRTGEEAGYGGR